MCVCMGVRVCGSSVRAHGCMCMYGCMSVCVLYCVLVCAGACVDCKRRGH